MKLLGIEMHWPSTKELLGVLFSMGLWLIILGSAHGFGWLPKEDVAIGMSAIALSGLASASGISIIDYGWRAVVLLTLLFIPFIFFIVTYFGNN